MSTRRTDHSIFERMAQRLGSEAQHCESIEAALPLIKRTTVIVCDEDPGGGDWKLLLKSSRAARNRPKFILIARAADGPSCAEALDIGAYDVLAQPLDPATVMWVIDSARPVPGEVMRRSTAAARPLRRERCP